MANSTQADAMAQLLIEKGIITKLVHVQMEYQEMTMFNETDQSMVRKRVASRSSTLLCRKNTEALKKVNKKILYILDRLPLKDQREVVKLNNLFEEQERLVRVRIKGRVPLRIEIFNDNERYRANHLRRRFIEAQRRNKIRETEDDDEDEGVYFGNKRSPIFHLPECGRVQNMSSKNIVLYKTRPEAINQGYVPCKVCKP